MHTSGNKFFHLHKMKIIIFILLSFRKLHLIYLHHLLCEIRYSRYLILVTPSLPPPFICSTIFKFSTKGILSFLCSCSESHNNLKNYLQAIMFNYASCEHWVIPKIWGQYTRPLRLRYMSKLTHQTVGIRSVHNVVRCAYRDFKTMLQYEKKFKWTNSNFYRRVLHEPRCPILISLVKFKQ